MNFTSDDIERKFAKRGSEISIVEDLNREGLIRDLTLLPSPPLCHVTTTTKLPLSFVFPSGLSEG